MGDPCYAARPRARLAPLDERFERGLDDEDGLVLVAAREAALAAGGRVAVGAYGYAHQRVGRGALVLGDFVAQRHASAE